MEQWYDACKFNSFNGIDVCYRQQGTGPTLLCIHGFPTSSWDYCAVWPTLTQHFNVITLDLIGMGNSSKSIKEINVALQATIIEVLLDHLGIHESHILAHDLGDTVAQELLALHADSLSKIRWLSCIFMNGGIFPEAHKPLMIQRLLASKAGPLAVHFLSQAAFNRNMTKIFSRSCPPTNEFLSASWQLLINNSGRKLIPKLIRYMTERITNRERWVAPITNSTLPLRLIDGIDDPISGKQLVKRYRQVVSNPDIVTLEGVGHYPHLEQPQKVLDAVLEFHRRFRFIES